MSTSAVPPTFLEISDSILYMKSYGLPEQWFPNITDYQKSSGGFEKRPWHIPDLLRQNLWESVCQPASEIFLMINQVWGSPFHG
jgi:hypothetical protein